MVAWDQVTRADVVRAIQEYDRLAPEAFFSEHGFAPTTTYDLVWDERRYPPKAILGTAYELATGQSLGSGDFEGGKTGAVAVLGKLGFTVRLDDRPGMAEPDVGIRVNGNRNLALQRFPEVGRPSRSAPWTATAIPRPAQCCSPPGRQR